MFDCSIFRPEGRLTIDGDQFRILHSNKNYLRVRSDDEISKPQIIGGAAIERAIKAGNLQIEPHYYLQLEAKKKSGENYLSDLKIGLVRVILWRQVWCEVFLAFEAQGKVRRTDASIQSMMSEMHKQVHIKAMEEVQLYKPLRAGCEIETRIPPSTRTLRYWLKRYEESGGQVLSLCPRTTAKGNDMPRVSVEELILRNQCCRMYLDPNRPTQQEVIKYTQDEFERINKLRSAQGMRLFRVPSASTIKRTIRSFDAYIVCLYRYGSLAAAKKFAQVENGISTAFPGEVIEIDEWKIDVKSLFASSGLLDGLSRKELAQIEVGRRWLYLAIDVHTRTILGLRLAGSPNSATAIELLQDIVSDKTKIARAFGCENSWPQCTGIGKILVDQGAAFVSTDFRLAVNELGGIIFHPPAGLAHLRGHVERMFRTFGTELMPRLTGQVHSRKEERGDHSADELACLSDDDIAEIFVRFVVDVYHRVSHTGLNDASPALTWGKRDE